MRVGSGIAKGPAEAKSFDWTYTTGWNRVRLGVFLGRRVARELVETVRGQDSEFALHVRGDHIRSTPGGS